jgi:uncharacterized protein (DUF4415 family)
MREDDRASQPDDDNPQWTREEIRNARPALDVIAETFGATAAAGLRRGRGRPPKADRKVSQNLRLDPDVLEAFQREGKGWQTRINQVLRENMPGAEKLASRR